MSRQACEGCKSRFFEDDESVYEGKFYCSYCRPKVRICGVCGISKVMKTDTPNDIGICEICMKETQVFPNIYLTLRFKCFQRDRFTCRYCGRSPLKDLLVVLNCDHIHPRAKRGKDILSNLITSCSECNRGKMDIMLTKYEMRYLIRRKTVEQSNQAIA